MNQTEIDKKENPIELEGVVEQTGACKFCGQIQIIKGISYKDEAELDEAASEICDCSEAKYYQKKQKQKKQAEEKIEELFGEKSKINISLEVRELINSITDNIIECKIRKATVNITEKIKANISITGKGNIKIEREIKNKNASEI